MKINAKKTKKKRTKPSKMSQQLEKMLSMPAKLEDYPEFKDSFELRDQEQKKRHLQELHEFKLLAEEQLHRAKLHTLMSELQSQLLSMWNDAWLQRKKTNEASFKEWFKVFRN